MPPEVRGTMASPKKTRSPNIHTLATQLAKDSRSKAFIPLADEYVKADMLHEAVLVLEDGLKVYPTFVTALVSLGRVYTQLHLPDKAQPNFEEAVKLSPDNLLAHRMLARIYVKKQQFEAAARSCDLVLFQFPKDTEMLALKDELSRHGADQPTSEPEAPFVPPDPSLPLHEQYSHSHVPKGGRLTPLSAEAALEVKEPEEAVAVVASLPPDPPSPPPRMVQLQGLLERIQARRAS